MVSSKITINQQHEQKKEVNNFIYNIYRLYIVNKISIV